VGVTLDLGFASLCRLLPQLFDLSVAVFSVRGLAPCVGDDDLFFLFFLCGWWGGTPSWVVVFQLFHEHSPIVSLWVFSYVPRKSHRSPPPTLWMPRAVWAPASMTGFSPFSTHMNVPRTFFGGRVFFKCSACLSFFGED